MHVVTFVWQTLIHYLTVQHVGAEMKVETVVVEFSLDYEFFSILDGGWIQGLPQRFYLASTMEWWREHFEQNPKYRNITISTRTIMTGPWLPVG